MYVSKNLLNAVKQVQENRIIDVLTLHDYLNENGIVDYGINLDEDGNYYIFTNLSFSNRLISIIRENVNTPITLNEQVIHITNEQWEKIIFSD